MGNSELRWFVFYTRPRAEKVTYKQLVNKGYEVFLPLQKKLRTWKNRQRKYIEEPLFPSYIFVKAYLYSIYEIIKIKGISTYIATAGKPCIIRDKDIESIKIMMLLEQEISTSNDFILGEKVRVINGPLIGYEGLLFQQKGKNRFGIQIQEINLISSIEISIKNIQKLS